MLYGIQLAINASRNLTTGEDTVRWKLVYRGWGDIVQSQYCDAGTRTAPGGYLWAPECPDVVNMGTTQFARAWASNQLQSLEKQFTTFFRDTGRGLRDEMQKYAYYDYYTKDAKPMAVPLSADTRLLVYNRTVFNMLNLTLPPPAVKWPENTWNWAKIVEYSRKIWESGVGFGFTFRSDYDEESKFLSVIARDAMYNVQIVKVDSSEAAWNRPMANKCGWGSDGLRRIMTDVIGGIWLRDKSGNTDIYNRTKVVDYLNTTQAPWYGDPLGSPINQPDLGGWAQQLDLGVPGIMWAGSTNIINLYMAPGGKDLFNETTGQLGLAHMPAKSCGLTGDFIFVIALVRTLTMLLRAVLGGSGLAIVNCTKHPDLAWEFVKEMLDTEMQILIGSQYTGVPPPYDDLIDNWKNDTVLAVIAKQLKAATPIQYPDIQFPQMADFESVHPARYMMTEIMYKGVAPEAAIARACWSINYLFTPDCLAIGSPRTNSSCPNYCDLLRNATARRSFHDLLDNFDDFPEAAISLWSYVSFLLIANTMYAIYLIRNYLRRGRSLADEKDGKAEEGKQEKVVPKSVSSTSITMTIWQARPTTANYLAVGALMGDWLQYSTVLILSVPEWMTYFDSVSGGIAWVGFFFDFTWYYIIILGVLLPLWLVYTITFWSGAAHKLAQFTWGKYFLQPATYILMFCGNFGFIPIVQALLKLSDCRYGDYGISMMDMSCTVSCWGKEHWGYVATSWVVLICFVPLQLRQAHVWQEIQDGLDIKDDQIHVVISLMIRLYHAIINRFFFNMYWYSLGILFIVDVAMAIYTWSYNTNNVVWVQKLARVVTLMTLGTAVCSIITHGIAAGNSDVKAGAIGTGLIIIAWVSPLAGFIWFVKRRYPPELTLFISGETAGAMERLVQMLPKLGGHIAEIPKVVGYSGSNGRPSRSLRQRNGDGFPPNNGKWPLFQRRGGYDGAAHRVLGINFWRK
ncbi:hypothetical protein HDV00_011610 [Rhizophlyctis rosea]|nr:hypothetical protein HDV00_011610 [Rhizophlyctis rosea]